MNVILLNSNSHEFQAGVPLGPMVIATLLNRDFGITTKIFDLPLEDRGTPNIVNFVDSLQIDRDNLFVGFSTMCNTLPRSLMVARALKEKYPEILIEFGGPQASATATRLLELYPFIDVVMIGEAEGVLNHFVNILLSNERRNIPGVLFRNPSCRQTSESSPLSYQLMAPLVDMDDVPFVDYDTYPQAKNDRSVSIEIGRGCPYGCAFCSTKDFFQQKYRIRTPNAVVNEILRLKEERDPLIFDFCHDMLTVNRKAVSEICQILINKNVKIKWGCSARTDRTDSELLQLMARAGCVNIFFGIETGSQSLQKTIGKRLNLDNSIKTVRLARELGMHVTVSTILGFPQEGIEDLADTINMIIELRSLTPSIGTVQVHMLSPLVGTALYAEHFEHFAYDGFMSDITSVNYLTPWEISEIKKHPDVFSSFYYIPNQSIKRITYKFLHWLLFFGRIYEELFRALRLLFSDRLGKLLIAWSSSQAEDLFMQFNHKDEVESVSRLATCLREFVALYVKPVGVRDRLLDLISFELWKFSVCHDGKEVIFASPYNYFNVLGAEGLNNDYVFASGRTFLYFIDRYTKQLKRLEAPESVASMFTSSAST